MLTKCLITTIEGEKLLHEHEIFIWLRFPVVK